MSHKAIYQLFLYRQESLYTRSRISARSVDVYGPWSHLIGAPNNTDKKNLFIRKIGRWTTDIDEINAFLPPNDMVLQKVQYCTNLYKRIPSSAQTLQFIA
ncbi:hypothetical protein BpHYR1_042899 [Brachionus plicatilis]|uniref:Uncharacterized protein n=1 Tax=Brachionus plicatilis TaxID=10195 RepID=A0A3M7SGG6_BRAPC|nr:hypothetical protein BpHYR1_042899 [Brachionus plicatilis]